MKIAKLGEAGKWHEVKVQLALGCVTACLKELIAFASKLRTIPVEYADGKPTCKHCLRKGTRK